MRNATDSFWKAAATITNWTEADPKTLWSTYIQLTEVEDAFRIAKHDLGMRPIYHQKTEKTQGVSYWFVSFPWRFGGHCNIG